MAAPSAPIGVRFDIDLGFSIEDPDVPGDRVDGTVTAAGNEITVDVSDTALLLGASRPPLALIRAAAAGLARRGVIVSVTGPQGLIVQLGAVQTNLAQRVATGSPSIRLGTARAVGAVLTRRKGVSPLISTAGLPPATLFPLVPLIGRRQRARPTTTHSRPGDGRPRLIFVVGSEQWDGTPPREFDLLPRVTTIGSSSECDLVLEGLDAQHARVTHNGDDEYVLEILAGAAELPLLDRDAPRRPTGRVLRTGARIDLGPWKMAYFREEFADHGRPFGGRAGGEFARQKPQPPRHGGVGREQPRPGPQSS